MLSYRLASLCLALTIGLAAPVTAQEPAKPKSSPQEQQLLRTARESATIAGGARYCRLDQDDIEEFIGKAQAQIVLLARDDYQKILGRLEFKNILAAMSAKEPVGGCDKLESTFNTVLRESR